MPPIVQRISLEGGEQVVATLEVIGKSGADAIKNIQAAANNTNFDKLQTGFKQIGEHAKTAFGAIESAAKRLAGVFGITLGAGIAGLGASLLSLAKSAVSAVGALNGLAVATGSTIDEMQALGTVFAKAGIGADELGKAFKKLAVQTQSAWEDIIKEIDEASTKAVKDQLSMQDASLGVAQAQYNLRQAYADLEKSGTSGAAGEQALLKVRSARLALDRANLAQSEAQRKAADDQANSVEGLAQAVRDLAAGEQVAAGVRLTPQNLMKGLVANAAPGGLDALKGLSRADLLQAPAPATMAVFRQVMDLFKNIKDETLKMAIAQQIFGREVDAGFVKTLSKGSAEVAKEREELRRLGLTFNEVDTAAVAGFKAAFRSLQELIENIKSKIGASFAPVLRSMVEGVTEFLKANVSAIKSFFDGVRQTVTLTIQAIINVFKGVSIEDFKKQMGSAFSGAEYQRIDELQKKFEHLRDTMRDVGVVLAGAFKAARQALDVLAAGIEGLTGFKITGDALGILLIIGHFTRLNAAIFNTLKLLGQIAIWGSEALVTLGWPAALAVAFVAAALLIYQNWDKIVAKGKEAGDAIKAHWEVIKGWFSKFGTFISESAAAGWKAFSDAWDGAVKWFADHVTNPIADLFASLWKKVVELGKAAWEWLKSTFAPLLGAGGGAAAGAPAGAAAGGGAAPVATEKAGGGLIRGPGTGTSDSILARLSTGEFVVRAAAVRAVGTGFLHAVNRAPGFALGGLVSGLRESLMGVVPRFATGGLAPSGGNLRPFTLVMPGGGGSFGGLYAQESSVHQMRRAAVHAQVASTGRRPAWVK